MILVQVELELLNFLADVRGVVDELSLAIKLFLSYAWEQGRANNLLQVRLTQFTHGRMSHQTETFTTISSAARIVLCGTHRAQT
jgi:hypothetical protein